MSFRILVVSKSLYNNHIGEEHDFIHEVPDQFCFESLPEHNLLLRGVLRSGWFDFDKDIEIIADCDESWNVLFDDLKSVMKDEEEIEFKLMKGCSNE